MELETQPFLAKVALYLYVGFALVIPLAVFIFWGKESPTVEEDQGEHDAGPAT